VGCISFGRVLRAPGPAGSAQGYQAPSGPLGLSDSQGLLGLLGPPGPRNLPTRTKSAHHNVKKLSLVKDYPTLYWRQ